jgi:hypothetical protein
MIAQLKRAVVSASNWKATASSIGSKVLALLTVLSQISYDQGTIALVIPAQYKPTVTWIAGASALVLALYAEWQKAQIRTETTKQLKRRH